MSGPGSNNGAGAAAREWWGKLQPSRNAEGEYRRGDRAAAARLRRASSWVEAAAEPQTIALFQRLGRKSDSQLPRVAALAAVLAHVRDDDKERGVARAIGGLPAEADEKAILKPLRLRRLLTAKNDEAILAGFRRLIALMGGKANIADLSWNILNWDHEKTRMKFAFDYWQGPAPESAEDNAAA